MSARSFLARSVFGVWFVFIFVYCPILNIVMIGLGGGLRAVLQALGVGLIGFAWGRMTAKQPTKSGDQRT